MKDTNRRIRSWGPHDFRLWRERRIRRRAAGLGKHVADCPEDASPDCPNCPAPPPLPSVEHLHPPAHLERVDEPTVIFLRNDRKSQVALVDGRTKRRRGGSVWRDGTVACVMLAPGREERHHPVTSIVLYAKLDSRRHTIQASSGSHASTDPACPRHEAAVGGSSPPAGGWPAPVVIGGTQKAGTTTLHFSLHAERGADWYLEKLAAARPDQAAAKSLRISCFISRRPLIGKRSVSPTPPRRSSPPVVATSRTNVTAMWLEAATMSNSTAS